MFQLLMAHTYTDTLWMIVALKVDGDARAHPYELYRFHIRNAMPPPHNHRRFKSAYILIAAAEYIIIFYFMRARLPYTELNAVSWRL